MNWIVVTHLAAALAALGIGLVVLLRPKGTASHKAFGRAWVALMALVAIGSFWITKVAGEGRWSWIHGLSAFTLFSLAAAVISIRRGNVRAHQGFMLGTFAGLCIAGFFAAIGSGRVLNRLMFGG